jgi:6-phosphogluconolactonase (cycloisomerase 2 family)
MHTDRKQNQWAAGTRLGAWLVWIVALLVALAGVAPATAQAAGDHAGAVYVMSNSPGGNAILVFDRAADGALTPAGSYATGGLGTGGGLGSQGSVVVSDNGRWVFAVNAGSDSVSAFAALPNGLQLTDTELSGGERPISVTIHDDLVYVLNAGGAGNIAGFRLSAEGQLTALAGGIQPLSNGGAGAAPGPAQVEFNPDGSLLVVTEKASNQIVIYPVGANGLAGAPAAHASAGATPFGFAFGLQGTLVVSEAFGGAPGASAASSYDLRGGVLQVVSASAPTHQTAACWVAVTGNGKFAYTTNAGSGSVSGYGVAPDGGLTLLDANGQTGLTGPGSGPADVALSRNSQFLYVVAGGAHQVVAFEVGSDGSLNHLGEVGIPAGAVGIAAR